MSNRIVFWCKKNRLIDIICSSLRIISFCFSLASILLHIQSQKIFCMQHNIILLFFCSLFYRWTNNICSHLCMLHFFSFSPAFIMLHIEQEKKKFSPQWLTIIVSHISLVSIFFLCWKSRKFGKVGRMQVANLEFGSVKL